MLHAAFLRSQHAHARLRAVEVAAARKAPGVVAVFDAQAMRAELTDLRMPLGFPSSTLPAGITPFVLSDREVCFVGEAVAMVVAKDRYLAEDAVGLIQVDYDPLPAVTDCKSAFENSEPRVRSDRLTSSKRSSSLMATSPPHSDPLIGNSRKACSFTAVLPIRSKVAGYWRDSTTRAAN